MSERKDVAPGPEALGRIVWGTVSGKLGRKSSIALMSLLQGVMRIRFCVVGGTEWALYLGAALIGFNFRGNFARFPAATARLCGDGRVGVNYPWVSLSCGVGVHPGGRCLHGSGGVGAGAASAQGAASGAAALRTFRH